ncbi:MAG: hypothetical protein WEC33_05140 [Dehalococcoidia bacterium]
MTRVSRQLLALSGGMLILAGVVGAALGFMVVEARDTGEPEVIFEGQNLIAGPRTDPTAPNVFIECLPGGSVSALYMYVPQNQSGTVPARWLHYFADPVIPPWVNGADAGGISILTKFDAVYLIANVDIPSARFKESPVDNCN